MLEAKKESIDRVFYESCQPRLHIAIPRHGVMLRIFPTIPSETGWTKFRTQSESHLACYQSYQSRVNHDRIKSSNSVLRRVNYPLLRYQNILVSMLVQARMKITDLVPIL